MRLTRGSLSERPVEDAVVLVCTTALTVATLWLLASTAVCLTDLVRRREPPAPGAPTGLFRPRLLVALLALAVAPLTGVATSGAQAHRRPELPRLLAGLPLPERPSGGVRVHRIGAGESLWSITAASMPPHADAEAVARAWPRVYRLNRQRIGPDPDLVHPGTTLLMPAPLDPGTTPSAPTRGALP